MVYIDREIAPSIEKRDAQLQQQGYDDFQGATDMDMFAPVHPVYTRAEALARPLPDALGRTAAGPDSRRTGAQAQHDRRPRGASAPASRPRRGDEVRCGHRRGGQGVSGRPRHEGRRHRRRGDDRSAEPRLQALRKRPDAQPGAREAAAEHDRGRPLRPGRCRRGAAVDVRERPPRRQHARYRRRQGDRDADDGRAAALRQRQPLLEHAARLRPEVGRSACPRGGPQISPTAITRCCPTGPTTRPRSIRRRSTGRRSPDGK